VTQLLVAKLDTLQIEYQIRHSAVALISLPQHLRQFGIFLGTHRIDCGLELVLRLLLDPLLQRLFQVALKGLKHIHEARTWFHRLRFLIAKQSDET
jgi:hypothetical protein